MVQLPFLLLFLLFPKGRSTLTVLGGKTVLYGSSVTLQCSGDTGVTWREGEGSDIVDGGIYTVLESGSKLEISKITKTTEFTCYKGDATVSTKVYVANIAGISSPICRTECEVSCTLSSLNEHNKPSSVTWSSISSDLQDLAGGASKTADKTVFSHRLEDYKYSAQETYLQIESLSETSYFTCTFTLNDGSVLEHTVSALIRPTRPCDVMTCTDKAHCQAAEVTSNTTCAGECRQCFTYTYIIGEFIDVGQCGEDKTWCLDYLENRTLCANEESDPIVKYCVLCGHCLKLEFSSSKLIMPLLILLSLCLLIALMCYKSYEERRSVLPKIKTKAADPLNGGEGTIQSSPTI